MHEEDLAIGGAIRYATAPIDILRKLACVAHQRHWTLSWIADASTAWDTVNPATYNPLLEPGIEERSGKKSPSSRRLLPVLDRETYDTSKLGDVVRDDRRIMPAADRCDHQLVRTDRRTGAS